jgi:hypothetical protein
MQVIDKIKGELGEIPTEANEIIKFLNSKTREELQDLKIEDMTETILEVKRVLTKRGRMLQLEEKFQNMEIGVQRFFSKIKALQKKGLPGLMVLNDKLMTLPNYKQKMATVAKDSSKFFGIQGSITGNSWRLCSQTLAYNTRSSIFSSSNRLFPSTQKWMKYTVDYSKSPFPVI